MSPRIRIVPVIEIEPGSLSDRPSPGVLLDEESQGDWEQWRARCMADAGLGDLRPLRPASWLYPTAQLEGVAVQRLIALEAPPNEVDLIDPELDPDECFSALSGGFAVLRGEAVIAEPGCCSDLGLAEWRTAVVGRGESWADVWNGHDGQTVLLRFDPAAGRWDLRVGHWGDEEVEDELSVPDSQMADALAEMTTLAEALAKRLEAGLPPEMQPANRRAVARRLAGLG